VKYLSYFKSNQLIPKNILLNSSLSLVSSMGDNRSAATYYNLRHQNNLPKLLAEDISPNSLSTEVVLGSTVLTAILKCLPVSQFF
jgi:hypothetical protein